MRGVVSGMDKAMKAMNLVKMTEMMDKFEQQQEDIDVKVCNLKYRLVKHSP